MPKWKVAWKSESFAESEVTAPTKQEAINRAKDGQDKRFHAIGQEAESWQITDVEEIPETNTRKLAT
jgi:hypothetical protein